MRSFRRLVQAAWVKFTAPEIHGWIAPSRSRFYPAFAKVRGFVWIDEAAAQLARVEVEVTDDVSPSRRLVILTQPASRSVGISAEAKVARIRHEV